MSGLDERLAREREFEGELFEGVDLRGRDLGGTSFDACTFRRCKLGETRWAGARLDDVRFEACDLTRANVDGLALRGVHFDASKLMGIDWTRVSDFPDVAFVRSSLELATFVDLALRKTRFEECVMHDCTFVNVDLQRATFAGSKMRGARFERCDLRAADLATATELTLDARDNRVQGARLSPETAARIAETLGFRVVG